MKAVIGGRKAKRQRGFVQNEPLIVLALFGVFCLLIGSIGGKVIRIPWYWGITAGVGLFVLGVGMFFLYVRASIAQEERTAEAKEGYQASPPDG